MEDISKISLDIEKLKLGLERLISHVESEGGTQTREWERMRKDIKDSDKKFSELFFGDGNGKKGILIKLDRLEQIKKIIYVLSGIVATILIKMIIDFITKK